MAAMVGLKSVVLLICGPPCGSMMHGGLPWAVADGAASMTTASSGWRCGTRMTDVFKA